MPYPDSKYNYADYIRITQLYHALTQCNALSFVGPVVCMTYIQLISPVRPYFPPRYFTLKSNTLKSNT